MNKTVTLSLDSPAVSYLSLQDRRLNRVISMVGPISYTLHEEDSYSFFIHEIIEQMLSVKAARTIYSRLEALCDGIITPERISTLSDEEIRATGTSRSKVGYIRNLTQACLDKFIEPEKLKKQTDKEIIECLTTIKGVGTWTAKMYLIFVLDRQDVLPLEDGAFLQVYRWMYRTQDCSRQAVERRCKKWSPYASVAARFCYRALDLQLTKQEFHLFKQA